MRTEGLELLLGALMSKSGLIDAIRTPEDARRAAMAMANALGVPEDSLPRDITDEADTLVAGTQTISPPAFVHSILGDW